MIRTGPTLLSLCAAVALAACTGNSAGVNKTDGVAGGWPAATPIESPPPLPDALKPLLDLSAPVLDLVAWSTLASTTDPIAFGFTFKDLGDRRLREFQLAGMAAQLSDGSRASPYHLYGHPDYNDQVARVPVHFPSDAGVDLYGEILLPYRGARPPSPHGAPLILALQGLATNVGVYRWWHQVFADAGYLVLAFDFTGQGQSAGDSNNAQTSAVQDAQTALTWLLNESPVKDFVDANRIGVIGHSMGAIATLELQGVDERIKAAVAGAPISKMSSTFTRSSIPIMIQTGDHDGPVAPIPFLNPIVVRQVYDELQGDRAYIVTEAADHAQHTNYPLLPTPTWGREVAGLYSLAWMDFYLRGDAAALALLTSAHAHLSALHSSETRIGGAVTVLKKGSAS